MKLSKKRIAAALLAAGMVGMTLVGCGAEPSGGSTTSTGSTTASSKTQQATVKKESVVLALGSGSEPKGLDPCTSSWGHGTAPLIQSTLLEYTTDKQIRKELATDYSVSEDGLIWTFKIRDDAYFTDGEKLTAKDVAFTFNTAKKGQTSLDLTFMKNAEAKDDSTVLIHLKRPQATFINTCCSVGIVPEHAYDANYATNPIGSGAYKFVEWQQGEQLILTRNDDYYGEQPQIKDVTLMFMEEDAALAAAKSGQADIALTSATLADTKIEGMHLRSISTMDNRGLTLPMTPDEGKKTEDGYKIGNNVTSDIAIRHALACGIDREAIAQGALNGYADPAYSENDGAPWCNTEAVKVDYDLDKAIKILEDAGWKDTDGDGYRDKDGVKASFMAVYPSGDSMRQAVGMSTAEQAKKLGIEIIVKGESWDDIIADMFSNAVIMGWGSSNPYVSYSLFHSSGKLKTDYYNPENYDNPTVDKHLENAVTALTMEDSYKEFQLAQWDGTTGTAMKADCPWVWLVNAHHLYFVKDGLEIGDQQLHAHGATWPLVENLKEWKWN